MRYRRRLRSRIIISFTVFGLGLTALFAVASLYMRARLEDQLINRTLLREVANFVEFKRQNPSPDAAYKISLFDAEIYSARKFANVPFDAQKYGTGVYDIADFDGDGKLRSYKLAVYKSDEYWAFLRFDVGAQKLSAQQLLVVLAGVVLCFIVLSWLIGRWLSVRVMSPVSDLAARLERFQRTGLREPLAPHFADDEVGQLARALDDYADRLTDLVERDREFNADVSHELRTPLAVIATTTELLLASELPDKARDRMKRIERAVRQSTELTDALLLLSRRERRGPSNGEITDVGRVVEQVVDVNRPHLGSKPVQVHVVNEEPITVSAPSSVVAVALSNLIGNAFKYTQQGEVTVVVGHGRVAVEDTGPGIKAEDAQRLFQRGVRGDAGGKGAGLGLAIVLRLCELYGWTVSLAPRPQGGAVAVLQFDRR
ncbi:MAG TPA: HAMP domain-containing sensor histidine kinase [Dokdonella sp.]|uniref:sensor histidine kinase n=1 Tax=Dokdonella sp. TaxID=2291710 RepID=UPI002D1B5676|nr:HAMP domain-containing sensor histidine kinase [Dokdonella sp.]HUD42244.1 HAMP domain-containing sensor histidine kinase [Dokdonella sp.]